MSVTERETELIEIQKTKETRSRYLESSDEAFFFSLYITQDHFHPILRLIYILFSLYFIYLIQLLLFSNTQFYIQIYLDVFITSNTLKISWHEHKIFVKQMIPFHQKTLYLPVQ